MDLTNKEWGLVESALFITLRRYINFTDFSFDLLLQICDAVAVAKILNVTLVIPRLEVNPVWQDSRLLFFLQKSYLTCWLLSDSCCDHFFCSSFADIFDVDHFITVLKDEVRIVRELPTQYAWSTRDYYATGIRATRIKTAPTHASAEWYVENVLPVIQR